jgi:methanethiol S-methyltransferase
MQEVDMAKGAIAFIYGLVCYAIFFAVFLYSVAFVEGLWVPRTIDSGPAAPFAAALAIDLVLLGVFAVQHSVMARPAFKRWWTKMIPPSVERSTFVLASSLALALLFWQWRPMTGTVWSVQYPAASDILWTVSGLGWLTVLLGTFMISHTHLFGLYQVWNRMTGKEAPEPKFQTRMLYGRVRHPLMLGFMIAFWAAPTMTVGRLLFAAASTGYILIATQFFEERDLVRFIGEPYRNYRKKVPAFLPKLGRRIRVEELMPGPETAEAPARR